MKILSKITSCTYLLLLITACNSSPKIDNNYITENFNPEKNKDLVLDDFENGNYWYAVGKLWNDWDFFTDSKSADLSSQWGTNGGTSLCCSTFVTSKNCTIPGVFACDSPLITDFSKYSKLTIDTNNILKANYEIAIAFQTGSSWHWIQTSSKKLSAGESSVEFDLKELNIEELKDVKRLLILTTNKNIGGSFYIDNIKLSE